MSATRLQVLEEARRQAEAIGAVEEGTHYFETKNGERAPVELAVVERGDFPAEDVCGVCIAGACALAEVVLGVDYPDAWRWLDAAYHAAAAVLDVDVETPRLLSEEITKRGTPYVLAVLDRMIEHEREATTCQ